MTTLESIEEWFRRAVPEPTRNHLSVQAGCHLEEVAEFAEGFGNRWLASHVAQCGEELKEGRHEFIPDPVPTLDALCDQIVTAIGVAYMAGWDILGALAEVDRANWSKFVDGGPVFNVRGKIAKGPHYLPPALGEFIKGAP